MMRNLLFAFTGLLLATSAGATTVGQACAPSASFINAGGAGGASIDTICPSFNSVVGAPQAGWILNSVTLQYSASISLGGTTGLNSVQVVFNPSVAASKTYTWNPDPIGPLSISCTGIGCNAALPGSPNSVAVGGSFSNFDTSFLVNLAAALTGGNINSANMSVTVEYDYTADTPTPEPATFCLLGVGILALTVIRRQSPKAP